MSDPIPFRTQVQGIISEKVSAIRADHAAAPWWRKWLYWRALWESRNW